MLFGKSDLDSEIDQQLNDMLRRELQGEPISLAEFLDAEAETIEEINKNIDQWNEAPEGMSLEEAQEMAEADRSTFLNTLKQFGLSLENRFQLCAGLCEQAERQPSPELLRVFCDVVSDNDYLVDIELDRHSQEEYIYCWADCKGEADELYDYLSERLEVQERCKALLAEARSLRSLRTTYTSEPSDKLEQVFQMYVELYEVRDDKDSRAQLMDNIAHLLQLANSAKALTTWKPLFLYQAMTQHKKRLLKSTDLHIDIGALWEYQQYKIEEDNGKNYKAYRKQLELFSQLCNIMGEEEGVDLSLCVCGFEHLSNLAEFYWMDDESDYEVPFTVPIDMLLCQYSFSCFTDREQENILLRESCYSYEQFGRLLRKIERRKEEDKLHALNQIDTYINEHVDELCGQFFAANQEPEQVKKLCGDILAASKLSEQRRPKTAEETEVFLIAINDALMDIVDGFADDFLASAGSALIGEACK